METTEATAVTAPPVADPDTTIVPGEGTAEPSLVDIKPTPQPKAALLGRIHDITAFASEDKSRHIITGLHYVPEKGFLEATNGRILIRVPVTAPPDDFPSVADKGTAAEVNIPVAQFKKALGNIPKNGPLAILRHLRLSVQGIPGMQKAVMTTTDLDTEQVVSAKGIEGEYPKTEQVIPTEPPKFSISLNPLVLEPIIDYAKKHSFPEGGGGSIRFDFTESMEAVRFEIQCKDEMGDIVKAYGVLMPMRLA